MAFEEKKINSPFERLKGKSIDQMEYELNNALLDPVRKKQWLILIDHCIQRFPVEYDDQGGVEIIDTRNNLKIVFDENLIAKVVER